MNKQCGFLMLIEMGIAAQGRFDPGKCKIKDLSPGPLKLLE